MATALEIEDFPHRRVRDLTIRAVADGAEYVIKNPRTRKYLKVGPVEAFLLESLDGQNSATEICGSFEKQFGEPFSPADLNDFVDLARSQGLLESSPKKTTEPERGARRWWGSVQATWRKLSKQNPLFIRVSVCDPDRFLNWLEPRTRFLWSPTFVKLAVVGMTAAFMIVLVNQRELISLFTTRLHWQTLAIAWLTVIAATVCHEFGHGLACKRHGGEVHEIGVLMMFFMPFLFCNVSDAWLLPSKRQRLLISFAGVYVDLLIWMIAVFVWRLTVQDTLVNFLAWIALTACGGRTFFNLNPLMKLDGYYLLSDWLEIPNLRRRAFERLMANFRWLLWGAARPAKIEHGPALLAYGLCAWSFSVAFLQVAFFGLLRWFGGLVGPAGLIAGSIVFIQLQRRLFVGFSGGEVTKMFVKRFWRTVAWVAIIGGVCFVPLPDRTSGTFQVRPVRRVELRAPVTGFLRMVVFDEGDQVSTGALVASFEIPDLASQIARKIAEIHESEADLRRLEAGPRPEELTEQREKVKRAEKWRDIAETDLARSGRSLDEELQRLELRIAQSQSELDYRQELFVAAENLHQRGGLAVMQLAEERKRKAIAENELKQIEAAKRSREAEGVIVFEGELARREKELADTKATLKLLEAGNRPEDIDAERARRARLAEEFNFLKELETKAEVSTPVGGLVTTPRLKEKSGQHLEKGELICVIEDLSSLEAEIAVSEQDASRIASGEAVSLKPRSQPYLTLRSQVERIAPAATLAEKATHGTVTVYCRLDNADGTLRSGMTGFGRIHHQKRPLGLIALDRAQRYLRTEFWW
jgi:putative peptide zinc metalloprotease protein